MFEVGDIVRVRAWDDLVSEFGTDSAGDILFPGFGWLFQSDKNCFGLPAEIINMGGDNITWLNVEGEDFELLVPRDAVEPLHAFSNNQFNDEDWYEMVGFK